MRVREEKGEEKENGDEKEEQAIERLLCSCPPLKTSRSKIRTATSVAAAKRLKIRRQQV